MENFNRAQQSLVFDAWKVLQDEQQLQEIIETSKHKPVVIFKHSTRWIQLYKRKGPNSWITSSKW